MKINNDNPRDLSKDAPKVPGDDPALAEAHLLDVLGLREQWMDEAYAPKIDRVLLQRFHSNELAESEMQYVAQQICTFKSWHAVYFDEIVVGQEP